MGEPSPVSVCEPSRAESRGRKKKRNSGQENDEDDEEDDEDEEDLHHQPAVGRDRLEIFEDLPMSSLHIELSVLHAGVDPGGEKRGSGGGNWGGIGGKWRKNGGKIGGKWRKDWGKMRRKLGGK